MCPSQHLSNSGAADLSLRPPHRYLRRLKCGEDDDIKSSNQPQSNLLVDFIDEILDASHIVSVFGGNRRGFGDEFVEV